MLNESHSMSSFGIEYRALSIFYLLSDLRRLRIGQL
jgi:hypothetical protein